MSSDAQLLELILHLKQATPEAARTILNSQPAIAYALIKLMVTMGASDDGVFHDTLSKFQSQTAPPLNPTSRAPSSAPGPAIPPHVQGPSSRPNSRNHTPPVPPQNSRPPPPSYPSYNPPPDPRYNVEGGRYSDRGYAPPPNHSNDRRYPPSHDDRGPPNDRRYPPYQNDRNYQPPPPQPYSAPPQPPQPQGGIAAVLARFPPEQQAAVQSVLSMTDEQIYALPPDQREGVLSLKASLGF
ncbi:hypothetical protein DL96DRAFT_1576809 [Flagelloscypha sp. PMI_526]|nr:hypothetical protein DL96DRAFT_1576809 [Flagelloscypha sp. PMI_526]